MLNKIVKINKEIYDLSLDIENELGKQFREDYGFFDSIIAVDFIFVDYGIESVRIFMSELLEIGTFTLMYDGEEYFSFSHGTMNKDYKETVLKVLNRRI